MVDKELTARLRLIGDREFRRGVKESGEEVEDFGDKMVATGHDAGFLKEQIAETEAQYKEFIRELDRTGNIDLLKSIRKERRQLRLFEGLKKELEKELQEAALQITSGDSKGAGAIGDALAEGIGSALSKTKGSHYVIAGLVALAAAALPTLGAMVSGAVLGGVGAGGLVGGFALAAQDPRVKAEMKSLGQEAKAAFGDIADEFAAPAIESLHVLQGGVRDIADEIEDAIAPIADLMPMLTKGLIGFGTGAIEGIGDALKKAEPVIRALAHELPDIGESIGDFFEIIASESDGAVLGLTALSKTIQGILRGTGVLLKILTHEFEASMKRIGGLNQFMADAFGWVPIAGDQIHNANDKMQGFLESVERSKDGSQDFSGALQEMGSIAESAADQIEAVQSAMDRLFSEVLDAREAARAYEEAIDALTESVAKNGATLDIRTKQGRANQDRLDEEARAILRNREINIANNMTMADANAIYDQQLEALRKHAYQLGLNKAQVDAFVESLKGIPAKAEVEVNAPGLLDAIARAKELARLLGSTSAAANAASGGTYVSGRAHGGPVMPNQTYVVGENGPEVLKMGATGGMVYSGNGSGSPTPAAVMSGATGGATRPVLNLTYQPSGDQLLDAFMAFFWPRFIRQVRLNGGSLSAFGV